MYKEIHAYDAEEFEKQLNEAEKDGFALEEYSPVPAHGDFAFTALMHKDDESLVDRIKAMREAQKARMNHMQKLADKTEEIIHKEAMKFYEEGNP